MQSLSVQAQRPGKRHGPFRVLVVHLFESFIAADASTSSAQSATRVVQLAVVLGLPPILLTLALIGSYSGLMPFGSLRPFSSQVQDHFLYMTYAFTTTGLVALLRWEAFFPTLLDVRVLGLLPISSRRLFGAKVLAGTLFLAIFIAGANLPGALFLPAIAGAPNVFRHILAHACAAVLAGCFAATFSLSLLALLEITCGTTLRRILAPLAQGCLVALLIVLLLGSTSLVSFARPERLPHGAMKFLIPPLWFTGIYETMQGSSPQAGRYAGLSHIGLLATGLSIASLLVLYPLAYRKRVQHLIEGQGAFVVRVPLASRLPDPVLAWLLPSARQRAAFHFVAQTASRIPRIRIGIIVAMAMGAGSAVVLTATGSGTLPGTLTFLPGQSLFVAAVVVLAFIAGACLLLGTVQEQAASWIVTSILGLPGREIISGMRRWVLVVACTLGTAILLTEAVATHTTLALLVREIVAVCGWSVLTTELFFVTFRDFPFASHRMSRRVNLACYLLSLVVGCPMLIAVLWYMDRLLSESWIGLAIWSALIIGVRTLAHRWYAQMDPQLWFLEEDEPMQRLHL